MNLLINKLGMIEIGDGIFAKVVERNEWEREFDLIRKEINGGFSYCCINKDVKYQKNGYDKMLKDADIDIDYSTQSLIIIKT